MRRHEKDQLMQNFAFLKQEKLICGGRTGRIPEIANANTRTCLDLQKYQPGIGPRIG